jgi:nucleotide-binding universal stress UspA family protein
MTTPCYMVVVDPTREDCPAVERGIALAAVDGARLHFYSCTCRPPDRAPGERATAALVRFRDAVQLRIRAMVDSARRQGVDATMELNCAPDWRPEMLAAAERCGACLVIKSSPRRSGHGATRSSSDALLLNAASCAVLLVRGDRDWRCGRLAAALPPATQSDHAPTLARLAQLSGHFEAEAHALVASGQFDAAASDTRLHHLDNWSASGLDEALNAMRADLLLLEHRVRSSHDAADSLLALAHCDLMMLRTH